jgi:hypothetical protein
MDFDDLAYGTREHRRAPRQHHNSDPEDLGHEIIGLGKVAATGIITVGVLGALGSAFNK